MTEQQRMPDPSLVRGAMSRRVSRRDMFRYAGAGAAGLSMASVLAACGVSGSSATDTGTGADTPGSAAWWDQQKKADLKGTNVNFTNWPQYIDIKKVNGARTYPTLDAFTQSTGIKVTYRADINDNTTFYASIRPDLEAGNPTGSDIIVITNGQVLSEMITLGYLIPLDPSLHPNFDANADPTVANPSYDANNKHTLAWQSGFTGIVYNSKYIDPPPTSFDDLLNTKYSGKIGMFADNADQPCLILMHLGFTPETSTPDQWKQAADWLQKQKDMGIVRKYYTQDYLTALENEDIWIGIGWSGDILIDNLYYNLPQLGFVIPEGGAVIWTDNMCIPQGAANPVGAEMLMDWYYKPDIAAQLTEWNNYVSPVPSGKDIIKQDAAAATGSDKAILDKVLSSPLVYPTPEVAAKVHRYRVLTPDEEQVWNGLFVPIYES
ncbi:MAG: spermidine/putrescine ABC transporter substrate-binding protein [Planctomycetaceae bacterium]